MFPAYVAKCHNGRCIRYTSIPYEHNQTVRLEDAGKFLLCAMSVEPVESLAYGDKINGIVRQTGILSRAVQRHETAVPSAGVHAGEPHASIRFDGIYRFDRFRKRFRENACSGANVRDTRICGKSDLIKKIPDECIRVGRSVFDKIGRAHV